MTAVPETPRTEEVFGVAKRMSLDLEKYPLHTHAAVITMMNTMVQHRKMALDMEMSQQQMAAQEAAMADARAQHAKRQILEDARIAEQMVKPPRQVIELDKHRHVDPIADLDTKPVGKVSGYDADAKSAAEPEYEQVTGG